jgi:hypothetical protein
MLVYVARITRELRDEQVADDAALYLQRRRIEETLRE